MIQALNLPLAQLKLTKKPNGISVFCIIRKKNLLLTPEEWVRQHIIHFLINDKNFPLGSISAEMNIEVNKLSRRCDIVIFNKEANPILIIECKAPEVKISEKTFHQLAQYNSKLRVEYLMMSNGLDHFICKVNSANGELLFLQELPNWEEIK